MKEGTSKKSKGNRRVVEVQPHGSLSGTRREERHIDVITVRVGTRLMRFSIQKSTLKRGLKV